MRFGGQIVATAILISVLTVSGNSATAQARKGIPADDRIRLLKCREVVFNSQLPGGAFVAVKYLEPGRPAFIDSYFGALSCQCLLAVQDTLPDSRTQPVVRKWLEWTSQFLAAGPDSVPPRIDGLLGPSGDLAPGYMLQVPDSHDSYAALYVAVAGRYVATYKATPSPAVIAAVDHCMAVLARCHDPSNGLYTNFMRDAIPPGKIPTHLLLDNIEVYQGLSGAVTYYTAVGQAGKAGDAAAKAKSLADAMHKFWSPSDRYFVAMANDVSVGVGWGKQPFDAFALSLMSALSHFDNVKPETKREVWKRFVTDFRPQLEVQLNTEAFVNEDPTSERVYLAAMQSATRQEQVGLLDHLRSRVDIFLDRIAQLSWSPGLDFPYSHRFAHMMVGLLGQTGPAPFPAMPPVPLDPVSAP